MAFSIDSNRAVAGWAIAAGSLGVLAISAAYAASPALAALPAPASQWLEGAAATAAGGRPMWWIGTLGPPADMVLAAGAMLQALGGDTSGGGAQRSERDEAAARAALGWLLFGLAAAVFVVVDAIAGRALVPLAAYASSSPAAYVGARSLFDALFVAGTLMFAVGSALTASSLPWSWARWAARALAAFAAAAALAFVAGAPCGQLIGVAIAVGSLAYTAIGAGLATRR